MTSKIRDLLEKGNAEMALKEMASDSNSARLVLADYLNERKLLELGIIDAQEFDDYHRKIIQRIPRLPPDPKPELPPNSAKSSIFLSYNHQDKTMALRIKEELEKYHIQVRMDDSDVKAGQSIEDFIAKQTRQNQAVMILLSKSSLKSSWVIYESMIAMFDELLYKKLIIPVTLDAAFEDNSFSMEIVNHLDAQIMVNKDMVLQFESKHLNPEHIQQQINRLNDARNQVPKVLRKLQSAAVKSVAQGNMENTLKRIAEMLISDAISS